MPSSKLSNLVDLAGAQVPTDLMYIVDLSAGAAGSKKSSLNDAFATITKNITDGALRFQGFTAPALSAAGQGAIYFDSTANAFRISENGAAYRAIGDVFGPGSSTDNAIVRFDLATGKLIQNSVVTISDAGAFTFPDDIRQTFNPGANASGINVGAQAGDPGTLVNGDLWYDSTNNLLRARINGASVSLGASTPPGGANTQVQFNNAGAFGGISGLTTPDGTNVVAGSGNLRATRPRFTTSIDDSNGNAEIALTAAAAAVNQFTISNAATGANPTLSATGTDAVISITISPKSTGFLESTGPLLLSGTGTINYSTPAGASVPTKISIPFFDPGAFGQIMAMGIANIGTNRRVMSVFDGRTTAHQPSIALFNPAESAAFGPSWEGSNADVSLITTVSSGVIRLSDGTNPAIVGIVSAATTPGGQLHVGSSSTSRIALLADAANGATAPIAVFSVNLGALVIIDSSANSYFGNGITSATPGNYVLNGTGGSGSNIAGGNLDIAGGKGTGNGNPGLASVRYPQRRASGTTLQSLTTNRYPIYTAMFSGESGQTIANTTTETSIFPFALSQIGTTTIEAGMDRVNRIFLIELVGGAISTILTPTLTIRVKIGSSTVANAVVLPTITGGNWSIQIALHVRTAGSAGVMSQNDFIFDFSTNGNPSAVQRYTNGGTITAIDFTTDNALDITFQWSAASASNSIIINGGWITIIN